MRRLTRADGVARSAILFGYLAYVYLTTPDVRSLRTTNPDTTAFIERAQRRGAREGRQAAARSAVGAVFQDLARSWSGRSW